MKKEHLKLNISDLKENKKNPKEHDDKLIKESIEELGFVDDIVVDEKNVILAGHGRLKALEELKNKEVDVIRISGWTKKQKEKYLILSNKSVENGGWKNELLKQFDKDLLSESGFSKDVLDEIFPLLADEKDDEVPDVPEKAKSKLGDIYQLGNHFVMCGDSTKKEDVEKLMDGKKADMVFTDPPYNIGFSYNQHQDKMKYDDYIEFCRRFFELLDSDRIIISPGPRNVVIWYDIMNFRDIGWIIEDTDEDEIFFDEGIWLKDNTRSGASCFHLRTCEPIIFYGKFKKKRNLDVFKFSRKIDSKLRKAQENITDGNVAPSKPVALIVELITKFGYENELVKDVFLGNGSTLIACEKTNRICYGMEIDPKYIDVIIKRWEDYTNKKAKKIN